MYLRLSAGGSQRKRGAPGPGGGAMPGGCEAIATRYFPTAPRVLRRMRISLSFAVM